MVILRELHHRKLYFLLKLVGRHNRNFLASVVHMLRTSSLAISLFRFRYKKARVLMSLDLHTSLSRDLINPLESLGIKLDRWSISASSYLFNEPNLRVSYIRGQNWKDLNSERISKFLKRYHAALRSYSGFVVSYTFSFLEVFQPLNKPILAINATRFESPFTFDESRFLQLNASIQQLDRVGNLVIISNNIGDKDYLKLLTGIDSDHIPNLCDYVDRHSPAGLPWVIHSKNPHLGAQIVAEVNNVVIQEIEFPDGFNHDEFAKYAGVILIPYNISTMRLFELTTAGFPVRIPSDRLLKEWASLPGVLSELSWVQVFQGNCPEWLLNTPADPNWVDFTEWWLERADWNDSFYFPNVSRFDSIEELKLPPKPFTFESIANRNHAITELWKNKLSFFLEKIE